MFPKGHANVTSVLHFPISASLPPYRPRWTTALPFARPIEDSSPRGTRRDRTWHTPQLRQWLWGSAGLIGHASQALLDSLLSWSPIFYQIPVTDPERPRNISVNSFLHLISSDRAGQQRCGRDRSRSRYTSGGLEEGRSRVPAMSVYVAESGASPVPTINNANVAIKLVSVLRI